MLMFGAVFSAPVNHILQDSTECLSFLQIFHKTMWKRTVLFLNKYWNVICTEEQLYSRKRCERKNQPDEYALSHIW